MANRVRPMNVHVAPGSAAERIVRRRAGLPQDETRTHKSASHDLQSHGGKTIPNLHYTNFYVGGASSWSQSDMQSIDAALAAALSDQSLNNVMMQYFQNQPISTTFASSQVLPGSAPAVVSQGDAENMIQQLYTQGLLNNFDLTSTLFNLMLPSGTILNDDATPTGGQGQGAAAPATSERKQEHHQERRHGHVVPEQEQADSLHGLGGYHGSIHVTAADGSAHTIYYAVGVYSETRPDGTTNGIPVFDAPWKNVVATFYHEANEMRTDADVEDAIKAGNDPNADNYLGWMSQQGEECGDYPVFVANPLTQVFQEVSLASGNGTVPVQFMYSNAVHGAEGPSANPV